MADLTGQPYGLMFPQFWDGETGQQICTLGGARALCLGAYLTSNQYATMLGLYPLPLDAIRIGLSTKELVAALAALDRAKFATYDYGTRHVWVRELARIRTALWSKSAKLFRKDSRVQKLGRLYAGLSDNPFLGPFYARYGSALHLHPERKSRLKLNKSPTFAFDGASHGALDGPSDASIRINKRSLSTYN